MNILVTGANRGLGLTVVNALIKHLPTDLSHTLFLTGRNLDSLNAAVHTSKTIIPNNINYRTFQCAFKHQEDTLDFLSGLPVLDHVFHTAAPYSHSKLSEASLEERAIFESFAAAESTLLIEANKKLTFNGSLIAAGAIIAETVHPKTPDAHPWYIGLSSIQKATLRSVMGGLAQERTENHRIAHANLGTFISNKTAANQEKITAGLVLATEDVATQLVHLALSTEPLPDFNIDMMSATEQVMLNTLRNH